MPSLTSAAASGAVAREAHRREENHPGGDENELDGHNDHDHPPDAARPGGNLGWALGCSGGPVDHEGSLRGKTKANLNDRERDADQEATPAALFIWPIARSRSCFVRIRLRMR